MGKSEKYINEPDHIVSEALDGLVAAYNGELIRPDGKDFVFRKGIPLGKVAILTEGGINHEPFLGGFVGKNLADGAVFGDAFTAPAPDQILLATENLDKGNGVLYLFGNYSENTLNFDKAAEMAAEKHIKTMTVRVWDDIASAPFEHMNDRHGIAGDFLVIKIAGAAAAVLSSLDEVYRVAIKARDNTRSLIVAKETVNHKTSVPTFEQPDGSFIESSLDRILRDLPFGPGDVVGLLINNLGPKNLAKILTVNLWVHQVLSEKNIKVHGTDMDIISTSQKMAGFSISLIKLDDELKQFYDMPAWSLSYTKGLRL